MKGTREAEGRKEEYKKGLWTVEEDRILMDYVRLHGKGHWNRIAKKTGLKRCGKSCRLRWMNYLSPNVKRGNFTDQEEDLIIRLHKLLGNRWSLIAKRVPGRTDNQVKNYWNTHLCKKLGIKADQTTMKTGESSFLVDSSPENSKVVTPSFDDPSNENGVTRDHETRCEDHDQTHQIGGEDSGDRLSLREIQAIPVIDHERNFFSTNSFWTHEDEFELSSLTMLDFAADGYCI